MHFNIKFSYCSILFLSRIINSISLSFTRLSLYIIFVEIIGLRWKRKKEKKYEWQIIQRNQIGSAHKNIPFPNALQYKWNRLSSAIFRAVPYSAFMMKSLEIRKNIQSPLKCSTVLLKEMTFSDFIRNKYPRNLCHDYYHD